MFWWSDHMNGWGYTMMTLSSIAFWGLVALGIIALVRVTRNSRDAETASESRATPQQLLAERYARGEIDDEEYLRRRTALAAHGQEISRPFAS